jgi:hypothetical protein
MQFTKGFYLVTAIELLFMSLCTIVTPLSVRRDLSLLCQGTGRQTRPSITLSRSCSCERIKNDRYCFSHRVGSCTHVYLFGPRTLSVEPELNNFSIYSPPRRKVEYQLRKGVRLHLQTINSNNMCWIHHSILNQVSTTWFSCSFRCSPSWLLAISEENSTL